MKLSERMKQGRPDGDNDEPASFGSTPSRSNGHDGRTAAPSDPVQALKRRAQEALLLRMGAELWDPSTSEAALDARVVRELDEVLREEKIPLNDAEREQLVSDIIEQAMGYGPIERFLDDPTISEVMVNSTDGVYIERDGRLELTDAQFFSEQHVLRVIDRIVAPVGRRIDEASPMVDARLPDGSRVNAVIPPLAIDGPQLTIRKFTQRLLTMGNLKELGTLTPPVAEFLTACVQGRMNILISGGTGSGKTTLLNVLSGFIPDSERIVTIEDAAELQLRQEHVVRLETRPPNIEGKGEVNQRALVRNALRMRPDRIILGEVRGGEAYDMLQAMNTGHEGSLATVHANTPRDALVRLENMLGMAGITLSPRATRQQIASAIGVIVQVSRLTDGQRKLVSIQEVTGMEGEVITMQEIFTFRQTGVGPQGQVGGRFSATGLRPRFCERLRTFGQVLPDALFDPGRTFE